MALERSKSMEAGIQLMVTEETVALEDGTRPKPKNISLCRRIKIIATNVTVEPIMFCYILPSVMASITTQNLTLEKGCRVNLGFHEDLCDALSIRNESYPRYKESEAEVQTLAANMAIWKNVIQSSIPAFLLLFLGSWSDRHKKRKPCILNPILGDTIMCVCFIICTFYFYELPLEVNTLAEALPPALTGGWFALFMGVFSYISGVTTQETRTVRIGAVHMFMNVSICIGIALSGILYETIGFYGVYSLAVSIYLVGYVYGLFFVKDICELEREADGDESYNAPKKAFLLDFFDHEHVLQTFKAAFKKGKRNRRLRICVILVLVMVIIGPMHGEMNVSYYFVRYKFGWNSVDYSIFSTFQFVVNMLGTIFSLSILAKHLRVDDSVLGMISSSSKIVGAIFYTFAPTPAWFYMGAVAEMLNGTSFIAMRSIVSKLVPSEELGKINSLFGLAEALVPLVYGPLYSKIYAATINSFPGGFFLTGALLTTPAVLIFIWLYLESRKDISDDGDGGGAQESLMKKRVEETPTPNADLFPVNQNS